MLQRSADATDAAGGDPQPQPTLGERRIRTTFNPSNNSVMQHIKERVAELINYIDQNVNAPEGMPKENLGEFVRLKSLGMTAFEEGAMWAVKAATT